MNMLDIAAALQARLAGIGPAIDTVVENTAPYVPRKNVPYQRLHLLPAGPDNPTMGDGFYRERGLYQVLLCYPAGQGAGAALVRAELIRVFFARGTAIFAGSGQGAGMVRIDTTPAIGPALIEGDRWCLPVRVRWSADVYP